jgi:hypothetical protein
MYPIKLTEEQQRQLDLMRAVGFPIRAEDGIYEWDTADMMLPIRIAGAPKQNTRTITDDFSKAVAVFEHWQKHARRFYVQD